MFKRCVFTVFAFLSLSAPAFARLEVVTAYPYISELVKEIGKNQLQTNALARGDWDPHFVVARPSLIARLRKADLLIINGAQLEIGWLPPLLRQANNAKIQPGQPGFLELSNFVHLIQKPQSVSRAMGDVHPQGNPHFITDPHNIPPLAKAISDKLCQMEPSSCSVFQSNRDQFLKRWKSQLKVWDQKLARLKGQKVLEYHRLHDYLLQRYGLILFKTIEPLPGIPPSPAYMQETVLLVKGEKISLNLRGVYNPEDPSRFVSEKTGLRLVTLPHDVGAVPEARDLFSFYDTLVTRLVP
ncbi:adhesin [bacterium (Candidatus Blackallbacteria) CG13_big_fil_rev_8_21_14_2_50_49_14]|nr:MAG: adhesin [bacterium (Candidatus Blackallbacteria) CG18_big_fil_WC_8_21_14_2_50_49_26]PIW46858.1 MAG: adhesin [bacterium (Candidatus Blackallbacteria) CG13_big_fil_rev_8_21_14_2_50_49_14]